MFPIFLILAGSITLKGQNVSIGHTAPVARLDIRGISSSPAIPGSSSAGVLRIGISSDTGIEIGKMASIPYTAWIQAGDKGVTPHPLGLQPLGGNVGIGTTTPAAKLEVVGQIKITGGSPGDGKVLTSDVNGLASWQTPPPPPGTNDPSVSVCCQRWMTKNLDVATYRNGDLIPKVTDNSAWLALTTGAYCYYNNDSATYAATYGKLYNWYAVNDSRGLAPEGWYIPTAFERITLGNCLGGDTLTGGPMKEIGTVHWTTPNIGATNLSGFTGLPSGNRSQITGGFNNVYNSSYWWSSTEYDTGVAWAGNLNYNSDNLIISQLHKRRGFSVRCLRD